MIATASETVVEILKKSGGKKTLTELTRELSLRDALGFGVETTDVLSDLMEKGKVTYDEDTETVTLV